MNTDERRGEYDIRMFKNLLHSLFVSLFIGDTISTRTIPIPIPLNTEVRREGWGRGPWTSCSKCIKFFPLSDQKGIERKKNRLNE